MRPPKSAVVVLISAVALSLGFRFIIILDKSALDHDEGISFLAATGHQGAYDQAIKGNAPLGNWARASEWKSFLKADSRFCFKKIGRDLANTDVHPPLYFWILHAWIVLFGTHLWTGPALNAIFGLLSMFFLFLLAREIFRSGTKAAFAVLIWSLSPAVLSTASQTRPYELLAMLTILFSWRAMVFLGKGAEKPKSLEFVFLAVLATLGILAHYTFILLIGAWAVLAFTGRKSVQKSRMRAAGAAAGAGVILFLAAHPFFYQSIMRESRERQAFNLEELPLRIKQSVLSLLSFFSIQAIPEYILLGLFAAAALVYLRLRPGRSSRNAPEIAPSGAKFKPIFSDAFLFGWTAGVSILLYLLFLVPRHAMEPRYLGLVWPFLAILIVSLVAGIPGKKPAWIAAILLAGYIIFGSLPALSAVSMKPGAAGFFPSAQKIVIDNPARGILPRIVWHVPDETKVFVAGQDKLLAEQSPWLSELGPGDFIISELSYGNSAENRERLLQALRGRFEIAFRPGGVYGLGIVYQITAPLTPP
jgi:uncharacterized membrane protein